MIESTDDSIVSSPRVNLTERQLRNFWSKVNKAGPTHPYEPEKGPCWEWTATLVNGYGRVMLPGTRNNAHRISFRMHSEIPSGLYVLHSCDNRKCVNPGHLELGTYKQNANQMAARGRQHLQARPDTIIRGQDCSFALLRDSDVLEIRRLCREGVSQTTIAAQFSVKQGTVSSIHTRKRWGHLP